MKKIGFSLLNICKIAFAYVGTVVGAGFASGQEVLRFFTVYGQKSIWAIILSALIFIYVGKRILLLGKDIDAASISDINKKIFSFISPVVTGYMVIAMVIICTAMMAGSGALFEEYLGVDGQIGILITSFLAIIVMFFGMEGILSVNTIIVPVLIIFNVIIFVASFFNAGAPNVSHNAAGFIKASTGNIIKSGLSYSAFNIILSAGVLAPMGREIKNPKILAAGGILGGAILGAMLLGSNYCLMINIPYIYNYEMPMLFIIKKVGSIISNFYSVILWGSIFTTLIANLFTVVSIVRKKVNFPSLVIALIVLGCGYILSFLGFSDIVSIFYPILGLIGIIFITVIVFI